MKRLSNMLKNMTSGVTTSRTSKKMFNLYREQNVDGLKEYLVTLNSKQFNEITEEGMGLLHHACVDENMDVVKAVCELEYADEVVNFD